MASVFLVLSAPFITIGSDSSLYNGALTPFAETLFPLAYGLLTASPAIAISLAILRNQLWDIDVLINRTLVYGSLTALLALLYFGLIFASQALLQGILPRNNGVAIVASTLAVAALVQPLRHRIQQVIDRRFYRRKYDAAQVVAAFSSTLRQEVDLDQLREQLLAVVEDTMQPRHIALWLPTAHRPRTPTIPTARPRSPAPAAPLGDRAWLAKALRLAGEDVAVEVRQAEG